MSHRRPLTDADRAVDAILDAIPELRGLPEGHFGSMDEENARFRQRVNAAHGYPRSATSDYHKYFYLRSKDRKYLLPEEVALWSRWRECRHVYRFDRALSDELRATDAPDDMPVESILRLPYPIVYVDAPIGLRTFSGEPVEVVGFFAWLDTVVSTDDWSETVGLTVSYVTPGFGRGVTTANLNIGAGTLGEVVDDSTSGDVYFAERLREDGMTTKMAEDYLQNARRPIVEVLNHLLYIVSDGSDQEVSYRPSGKARRASRTSPSTIHEVGTRIGRALGQARVRYESQGRKKGSGRSPRAHMRAGHWHHHWTGPKSDPRKRKLVLRWHDPVLVNAGAREASSATTIHPVLRG